MSSPTTETGDYINISTDIRLFCSFLFKTRKGLYDVSLIMNGTKKKEYAKGSMPFLINTHEYSLNINIANWNY